MTFPGWLVRDFRSLPATEGGATSEVWNAAQALQDVWMKLAKGLKINDLVVGSGRVAEKGTVAIAHVTCFLNRGDKLYSTHDGLGVPAQFEVGKRRAYVAAEQGVVGMREGGVRRVTVGPHLTYSEQQRFPNLPKDAMLRYEIELQSVRDDWDNSLTREYEAS